MVDYVDNAIQRRPPLRAELQAALNLIPAHTWYAVPSGALTFLNERHMLFAWMSLFSVGLTDFYIRCLASGLFKEIRIL